MTESQKRMVLNFRDKLNCIRAEAIRDRVNEKLVSINKNKQYSTPLIKLKISDELSFEKTAILIIWRPAEEIISMIQEGKVYEVTGTTTRPTKDVSELKIFAGKNAIFKKQNVDQFQVPVAYRRRHISISEILSVDRIMLNELDTTGFVVHVGDVSSQFQPVYIADNNRNIVCMIFWQDLKSYAYDDVVQPNRFLAIRNLQWRLSSNSKPIPYAYVTECSIFTENPQSSELLSAMTNLKMKFKNVKMDEFIDACMEKIKSTEPPLQTTPGRIYSNSSMQSSTSSLLSTTTDISTRSGHSSLSNKSRIDQLSKYGNPMPTPPMQINSLNKSYKLPVSGVSK